MLCYKCRANVSEDSLYCHECGANLLKGVVGDTEDELSRNIKIDNFDFSEGEEFGDRYKIIEELGRGGMGRVYKAEDRVLGTIVSLKTIRPEYLSDKRMIERFKKEILLAREITNENVVRIHDFGEEKGVKFITMNYIEGRSLKEIINDEGPLTFERILSIAKDICRGLIAVHKKGIIHRDLKPQNIMIGNNDHVYLTDFGLAKSIGGTKVSQTGLAIGTPQYIAPEQWRGEEADKRSDIYTLGIVLYEMVTGKSLFTSDTDLGYLQKHLNEKPVIPQSIKDELPLYFIKIILKCLEKECNLRYQSAEDVLNGLEEGIYVSTPVLARIKHLRLRKINFLPAAIAAFIFIAVLLLKLFVPGTMEADRVKRRSVAILSFKNLSGLKKLDHLSNSLSELLITDLGQSKFIKVMPEAKLFKILNETDYMKSNNLNSSIIEEINEQGNINYLIYGSFVKSGEFLRITAKLLDLKTGELVDTSSADTEPDRIFPAVDRLTRELKRSFKLTDNEIFEDIDTNIENITTSSQEALKCYIEGKRYFNYRKFDESIERFNKAVKIDPEFAIAYRAMAWTYAYKSDWDKRKEYFEKTIKYIEKLSEKEKLLIYADYYGEQEATYQKSIDYYKKLLEIYPDDFDANFQLGISYRLFEEWEDGIKYLTNALKEDNTNIYVVGELVECYSGKGDFKKSEEIITDYESKYPKINRTEIFELKYDLSIVQRKFDLASIYIDELKTINNINNSGIFFNKVFLNIYRNEYGLAHKEIKEFEKQTGNIDSWPSLNSIKYFSLLKGEFNKFIDLFEREIKSVIYNKIDLEFKLIDFFIKANRPEKAIERIEKLDINKNIKFPTYYYQKLYYFALVQNELGNIKKAEDIAIELKSALKTTLFKKQSARRYYFLLGKIEKNKGNNKKAEEYFLKVINLLPGEYRCEEHSKFYFSLAKLYYISGQFEKSEKWFKDIRQLTRGRFYNGGLYVKSFYYLGKIYQKKGWAGKAIESYEKFCSLWKDGDKEFTGKYLDDTKLQLEILNTNPNI